MHRPLQIGDLRPDVPDARLGRRVYVFDSVDSTNTFLLSQPGEHGDGALASAEFQSAGRGRLGRPWQAPRGSSLLLSFLLIEPPGSPLLDAAPLLAAVAICEAIEDETDVRPAVRWPNDVTVAGRKLGGVLVESTPLGAPAKATPVAFPVESTPPPTDGGARAIVVGVGLNCLQQAGHFPPELSGKATSLEIESAAPVDRPLLARRLVTRLDARVRAPLATTRQAWRERCEDLGQSVRLLRGGREFAGSVVDVDAEGDLMVELASGGRRRFESATTTRLW